MLFASIRKGEPINDGERMATSTLLGIMGRMAAYTGQSVTWEQAYELAGAHFPGEARLERESARRSDGPTRRYKAGIALMRLLLFLCVAGDFLSAAIDFGSQIRPILQKECMSATAPNAVWAACVFIRGRLRRKNRFSFPANRMHPGCTSSWR